jgi:hypothetical protein
MLEDFETTVDILVSPQETTYDEELDAMVVIKEAEYYTQVVPASRPETKTLADVQRVTRLSKPQRVIDMFTAMWKLGLQWDWYESYILWLNAIDTWEKWETVITLDDDGTEMYRTEQPSQPVEPIRPQ